MNNNNSQKPYSRKTFLKRLYDPSSLNPTPSAKAKSNTLRETLRMRNQRLLGLKTIDFRFNANGSGGAYTTVVGKHKKKLMVVINSDIIAQIADLPPAFPNDEAARQYAPAAAKAIYGLNYHELSHVLFTDMASTLITQYFRPQYRPFLHQLFNIFCDKKVESIMREYIRQNPDFAKWTNPGVYFDFINSKLYHPELYQDRGDVKSFLHYILLVLNFGRSKINGTCAVFDKYLSGFGPLAQAILREDDPTRRIERTIELGEWLIDNVPEIDWANVEEPENSQFISPENSNLLPQKGGKPAPTGTHGGEEEFTKDSKGQPLGNNNGAGGLDNSDPDEEDEENNPSSDDQSEGGEEESEEESESESESEEEEDKDDDESESESEEEEDPDEVDNVVDDFEDDVIDDFNHDEDEHTWAIAKDLYEPDPRLAQILDERADKFKDSINNIAEFLTLFKGRVQPKLTHGFTSGRLYIKAAMQDDIRNGCETKLFDRKIQIGEDKDIAVSLLCDNSGSMSGMKSEICTDAALALAYACEWSGIPFECNAFTQGYGGCYTIVEKTFEETMEEAKPFFAINSSNAINMLTPLLDGGYGSNIPTFHSNIEEINLYYVGRKLQQVDHKTKLLFVICDGMTCGSESDLADIVRRLEEEQGIIVIGIGVQCDDVAHSYPHHKIFHSIDELQEGLAEFLIETLSEYAC